MQRPDFERLAALEDDLIRHSPTQLLRNLRLVEGLYQEARALGCWPPASLEGVEIDQRVAQAFNTRRPNVRTPPR